VSPDELIKHAAADPAAGTALGYAAAGIVAGRDEYRSRQPKPVPNDQPSIQGLVRADLEQREQIGIARYGTPLQAHNGRDALRDAYEEALDLACYLRHAIEERGAGHLDGFDVIYHGNGQEGPTG
jgi:hypothetical protein